MRTVALLTLLLAIIIPKPFIYRLCRNAFTPAIPRPVEPRYPLVEEAALARDVTVIVGTKDSITPTLTQLRHLAAALPAGVRVIYTYPRPPWADAATYLKQLKEAAGPDLAKHTQFLPVASFSNPFDAWLQAIPHVRTKYTLLMHNDVFLLDGRGHFLSELHGALEAHEEHAVAAPQIYETELEGLLTTHLFNTNLHLRLHNATGVAFMSHEVDLLTGLSREPSDFVQRMNTNFLEDHVFLARTPLISASSGFLDPQAAFTLEYVDLHLNMVKANLTQLYVPSARAEFRLWDFGWIDMPYFVRRRSEEHARLTKRHLEAKWGVEFPNTGFCNFVKFSVTRHLSLRWPELPARWHEQAALLAAWFEMVGFNRHNEMPLGELLDATIESSPASPVGSSNKGLAVNARRELVSTKRVDAGGWRASGIGDLLPFLPAPKRLETRYQVEHMSLAVLRVPLLPMGSTNADSSSGGGGAAPFVDRDRIVPLCGVLVREQNGIDVCWIYVAPHAYDHPLFQALEGALARLRVGPRVALALAMRLTNTNLEPGRYDSQIRSLRAAGVGVTMCGEHHWNCEVSYDFPASARLLRLSGRMNSWETSVRTLLPHAEELTPLYAVMALLVCLGAAATAHSATQAKGAVATLALDALLTYFGITLAHAPVLAHASTTACLRPSWRFLLASLWLLSLLSVNSKLTSRFEALAFAAFIVAICTARRLYLALLTLRANHKPSLALPLLYPLLGASIHPKQKEPTNESLACIDQPLNATVITKRVAALKRLRSSLAFRWPRAAERAAALCGTLHEATPLQITFLNQPQQQPTKAEAPPRPHPAHAAERTTILRPITPSADATAATAGTIRPPTPGSPPPTNDAILLSTTSALAADNSSRLSTLSRKECVLFYLSAAEALQAAARLLRTNTGRPLLVTFGGGSHGWSDGVAASGLALGEERYACDVLTLRERSAATLAVLRLRRDEIAAVLVSPLQGVASTASSSCEGYRSWLQSLRAVCTDNALPLMFDEGATGFRLAAGGAQEFFDITADVVCYGRAAGGGLPLGVVCGPEGLLAGSEPHHLPMRAGGCAGGPVEHRALMASANAFLRALPDGTYTARHARTAAWAAGVNAELITLNAPLRIVSEASVWRLDFLRPSRHHFLFQAYLAAQGAKPVWISPTRLGFGDSPTDDVPDAELAALRAALVAAAAAMLADGWWAPLEEVGVRTDFAIRCQLVKEVAAGVVGRLFVAARARVVG